jgi:hypothetical protein
VHLASSSIDGFHDLFEALGAGFKIFNNLFGQHIRIRQVVQISQALIPDPEDIQAGFVPGGDLVIAESAPPAVGVVFRPGFFALMEDYYQKLSGKSFI